MVMVSMRSHSSHGTAEMFIAEATGADTYAAPDSGEYVRFGSSSFPGNTAGKDDFSFNPTAIDMDGDGKERSMLLVTIRKIFMVCR